MYLSQNAVYNVLYQARSFNPCKPTYGTFFCISHIGRKAEEMK
ncbi:hypothetical protein X975_02697, partial [Stegodyphus mimosarum]